MDQTTVPAHPSGPPRLCFGVALVGFMGAGKTTVGTQLAARLGWRFDDLDHLIEKRERRTIEQIFVEDGEVEFRRLEYLVLRSILKPSIHGSFVIALGGGAFIEPDIQEMLRDARIPVVFLDAPGDELFRRCEEPGASRPLRRDPEQFSALYARRRPEYLKAHLRVDTTGKPISAVAEEIIAGLNLAPASGAYD
jgi:shikimate kinase